jgi:hypothetical protein
MRWELSLTIPLCTRRREGSFETQTVNGALEGQFIISQRNEIADLKLGMRATCFRAKKSRGSQMRERIKDPVSAYAPCSQLGAAHWGTAA